jgi:hypothetical protein
LSTDRQRVGLDGLPYDAAREALGAEERRFQRRASGHEIVEQPLLGQHDVGPQRKRGIARGVTQLAQQGHSRIAFAALLQALRGLEDPRPGRFVVAGEPPVVGDAFGLHALHRCAARRWSSAAIERSRHVSRRA